MESHVLSHAYYPIMKGIFKHLRDEDVIKCYFVSKDFRYAKEQIHQISSIKWSHIIRNLHLNKKTGWEFIKDFNDTIDWGEMSSRDLLYIDSSRKTLTTKYIGEFKGKDWHSVYVKTKLSENFIREFKDKVDWENISIS